jgi:hypothetical protein
MSNHSENNENKMPETKHSNQDLVSSPNKNEVTTESLSVVKLRIELEQLFNEISLLREKDFQNSAKIKDLQDQLREAERQVSLHTFTQTEDKTCEIEAIRKHYAEKVDIIVQSETDKIQRDLREAIHLLRTKDELVDQLKNKILQLEAQCQAKEHIRNVLATKLKNQEDLIVLFERNYNSIREQMGDMQKKFEKEKLYVENLKKTHESLIETHRIQKAALEQLKLENQDKETKLESQKESFTKLAHHLQQQTLALDKALSQIKAERETQELMKIQLDTLRCEKEDIFHKFDMSQRLLTESTNLLKTKEDEVTKLKAEIEELQKSRAETNSKESLNETLQKEIEVLREQLKVAQEHLKEQTQALHKALANEKVAVQQVETLQKRVDLLIEQNTTAVQNSQVAKEKIASLESTIQALQQQFQNAQTKNNELQKKLQLLERPVTEQSQFANSNINTDRVVSREMIRQTHPLSAAANPPSSLVMATEVREDATPIVSVKFFVN